MIIIYSTSEIYKNPVLNFYLTQIEQVATAKGLEIIRVDDTNFQDYANIQPKSVITLDAKSYLLAKKVWRQASHGVWFQGVMPEEVFWSRYNPFYWLYWTVLEYRAYRNAESCLLVSEQMKSHYSKKYGSRDAVFIVPCLNRNFDAESIVSRDYQDLKLVYAGSMNKWQEVEKTIKLFRNIKKQVAGATLKIFTGDVDAAKQLLLPADDIAVESVSDSELNKRLNEYSYGFVLRRPSVVNLVSTPTKISTYLASGVIPIVTDSIGFVSGGDEASLAIPVLSWSSTENEWAAQIISYCSSIEDGIAVCKQAFNTLYSKEQMENTIEAFLKALHR